MPERGLRTTISTNSSNWYEMTCPVRAIKQQQDIQYLVGRTQAENVNRSIPLVLYVLFYFLLSFSLFVLLSDALSLSRW